MGYPRIDGRILSELNAGLVIEVRGARIITIEGNTNRGGSRDGFGVFCRDSRAIRPNVLLGYLDFCDI